jgi:hypothetical protein
MPQALQQQQHLAAGMQQQLGEMALLCVQWQMRAGEL